LTSKDIIKTDFNRLFPELPDSSWLLVSCARGQYSASAIARAVEDCDANLINLNVTADTRDGSDIFVEIRVDHRCALSVARSLERYGYQVVRYECDDSENDAPSAIDELMKYLEM
jgi:hypothetical protein